MTSHSLCPLSPLAFAIRVLWRYLGRVKILGHAFSLLMQQGTGLSPLGGIHSPWRRWEAVWPGCIFSREHACLRVVEWPHVIIPVTGGATSCHCKEGRQNDSVILAYWQVDCAIVPTGRPITYCMKDSWMTACFVPSGRHIPVTVEDWQIYTIVLGTSSIKIILREQHQSIVLKTGRSITWHHANQWLNPKLLDWGLASTTVLSDCSPSKPTPVHQTRTGRPTPRNTPELLTMHTNTYCFCLYWLHWWLQKGELSF